jgi:hypothetical protein
MKCPNAPEITITADCGGWNGSRVRLCKVELQKLADDTKFHHQGPTLPAGHLEME